MTHPSSHGKTVHVLLVDDNAVDREAVRRAFHRHRIGNPFYEASDGLEALDMLKGTNGEPKLPRPHLVLLDINMPRMNGIEFLQALREDADLHDTVVFVLTTSKSDEDKVAAYQANPAGYVLKSDVGAGFVGLVTLLDHYWRIVEFPPKA
jgi:CheY-like chemotaxis protein